MMDYDGRGYAWAASMDVPLLCVTKPFDSQAAGNGRYHC